MTKLFSFCTILVQILACIIPTFCADLATILLRPANGIVSDTTSFFSPHFVSPKPISRVRRYSIEGSYWGVKVITWKISKPSQSLPPNDVYKVLRRAFKVWEEQTDLIFQYKPDGSVHIDIIFAEGEHGDGEAFDGRGKILAHAYFPRYGGDVHFDDAEQWSADKEGPGIDLYAVAVHEIGHSLGLKHSAEKRAIMAPFYQKYTGNALHLHLDDVTALSHLYGKDGGFHKDVNNFKNMPRKQIPDICKYSKLDAITRIGNGSMYAFQGEYYWELLEGRVADGYPRLVAEDWPFDGHIDTTLSDLSGDTYVFKGDKYWLVGLDGRLKPGYPRTISRGLVDMANNLDASLVWNVDDRPYFFKKDKFWRYSIRGMPRGYPRSLRSLSKIHKIDRVDAALRHTDRASYLFAGEKYYRIIGKRYPRIAPGYPKSISTMWFGCDGNEHYLK